MHSRSRLPGFTFHADKKVHLCWLLSALTNLASPAPEEKFLWEDRYESPGRCPGRADLNIPCFIPITLGQEPGLDLNRVIKSWRAGWRSIALGCSGVVYAGNTRVLVVASLPHHLVKWSIFYNYRISIWFSSLLLGPHIAPPAPNPWDWYLSRQGYCCRACIPISRSSIRVSRCNPEQGWMKMRCGMVNWLLCPQLSN